MRLIIVDGLDGVGKDTHALLIKKRYEDKGDKVVIRSHPSSDNFFGRKAKKALLGTGKIDTLKAAFFYLMDVLRSVKKYYERDDIDTLIMVRYLLGTAYLPSSLVGYGYRFFYNFVPTSEYMFFLDAEPSVLLDRVGKREKLEIFENLEKFRKVREKALSLVNDWYIIDTSGSIEETFSIIEKFLDRLDERT
ncbi:MAG: thymidylate kinase [Candidatus Thermoplasmatota archaeon]